MDKVGTILDGCGFTGDPVAAETAVGEGDANFERCSENVGKVRREGACVGRPR